MTGQHTGRTPIWGNTSVKPTGQEPLPDSTATVAKILKAAGYRTGMLGAGGGPPTETEARSDRPFLACLPVTIPHAALSVPASAQAPYTDAEGNSIFEEPSCEGGHLCRCLEKNLSPNRADARHQFCEGERNLFIYSSLTA